MADILQLNKLQLFDLMAIPSSIINRHRSGTGQVIVDVCLFDGIKYPCSSATEPPNATMSPTAILKQC